MREALRARLAAALPRLQKHVPAAANPKAKARRLVSAPLYPSIWTGVLPGSPGYALNSSAREANSD